MSKTAIIIPARYGSSRLEGKPLIEVEGKPIIQWVYEKAQQAKLADMIIVATDDERIFNAVKAFTIDFVLISFNSNLSTTVNSFSITLELNTDLIASLFSLRT